MEEVEKTNKKPKKQFVDLIIKIAKTNSENWFSFFSGVIANIPITLLLAFNKTQTSWVFWLLYGLTIFISFALVVFSINFTITIINIKEFTKNKYEQYVAEKKVIVPAKYDSYLKEECEKRKNKINIILFLVALDVLILLALVTTLWIIY